MDKVAGSGNDEFYTPLYAVLPIEKYLKKKSVIWCPFDNQLSMFVQRFTDLGHKLIFTHIENGDDFFKLIGKIKCDYIISNPPYSLKTEVLEKLFESKTPFAMLVGVVGLFESQKRFNMFNNNDFEILYMNRRVSYLKNYLDEKPKLNPPFSSVYVCSKILPKKIVFEEINKKIKDYPISLPLKDRSLIRIFCEKLKNWFFFRFFR